jgi:glycosyltransferase involved in cell wall biosynthesis
MVIPAMVNGRGPWRRYEPLNYRATGGHFLNLCTMIESERRSRRILFLMAHLHRGGMQRAVSNITRALAPSLNLHVAFFGTDNPGFVYEAKVHDLAAAPYLGRNPFKKLAISLRRVVTLRRLVNLEEIDTVISFGEIANVYNLLTPHPANKVISIRVDIASQLQEFGWFKDMVERFIRKAYGYADRIVCVSQDLEQYVKRSLPAAAAKTHTIHNLYAIDHIASLSMHDLPRDYRHLLERRYIAAVGSLISQKGFDVLIRVFATLRDKDLRLVLIGSGPELPNLLRQASDLGVSERVLFIPYDENPFRYMARATIFALPSRYEGFPNVLVEAMASGAPVVAFDCATGPREIIGNSEWGKLVPDGAEGHLRLALEHLLSNQEARLALSAAGRKRALDFSASNIAAKWEQICFTLPERSDRHGSAAAKSKAS